MKKKQKKKQDLGIGEHADELGDDVARADERDRAHVGRHVVHHAHTPRAQLRGDRRQIVLIRAGNIITQLIRRLPPHSCVVHNMTT